MTASTGIDKVAVDRLAATRHRTAARGHVVVEWSVGSHRRHRRFERGLVDEMLTTGSGGRLPGGVEAAARKIACRASMRR